MSDTGPAAGVRTMAWRVTYPDGEHTVRTRPGDYIRADRQYPGWKAEMQAHAKAGDPPDGEPMMYLAWLASRHNVDNLVRGDFEAFLDDVIGVEFDLDASRVDPTGAGAGNGSPSRSPSPPAPTPPAGSPLIPQLS